MTISSFVQFVFGCVFAGVMTAIGLIQIAFYNDLNGIAMLLYAFAIMNSEKAFVRVNAIMNDLNEFLEHRAEENAKRFDARQNLLQKCLKKT